MRPEGAVAGYLLATALLLSLALLREPKLTPRAGLLFIVAFLHFVMSSFNFYYFFKSERSGSDYFHRKGDYFYDPDFGKYWRWG
jgi:hypothetical protein